MSNYLLQLTAKVFEAFQKKELKNIFRRSAGLPSLVASLLKANNDPDLVEQLIQFAQSEEIEFRIHSMNTLRKLFLESSLRIFMEAFISRCFQLAITQFGFDDWSVRNSALMLFSALASRTLGKGTNMDRLTLRRTIVEFFSKFPDLIDFFLKEIFLQEN